MSTVINNLLLLLNDLMSSKYSTKCNFCARHKGQRQIFVFPWTFPTINHLILYFILFEKLSVFATFPVVEIFFVKKEGNKDFDVPMGCSDGAEVRELVGSYILKQL